MHHNLGTFDTVFAAAPTWMFAAFDAFWVLVAIGIGSAIFEWLKKKGRQPGADEWSGQEPHGSPDHPSHPAAPLPKAGDWEAELRRLLGETPTPAPPPAVPPPPQRAPAPPPVSTPRPIAAPLSPPVIQRPIPAPIPIQVARPLVEPEDEELPTRLTKLNLSKAAYEKAGQLHASVAEHLRQIDERTGHRRIETSTARREPVSPDAVRAISLVRNRQTVRQAVITSLILGPPKALASE